MVKKNNQKLSCWVITEGMAGTENQCVGIAESLGIKPSILQIKLKEPWATFSPWLGFEQSRTFTPNLKAPWPDILITSGRKAIAAARYIKKQSKGKTFTVHTQDPRTSLTSFDLVAVPYHDPSRGNNVIVTDTAPNRITSESLEKAKDEFPALSKLSSPRIAVLIGGTSKAYKMSESVTISLIENLQKLRADGYSLMITASRRTGSQNIKLLQDAFNKDDNSTILYVGEGHNPYFGYLAYADYILVTSDSVSMVSDALTTGKPVYLVKLEGGAKRISKFHSHLINKGLVRWFDGSLTSYNYEPVMESVCIASIIRNKMGLEDE
jgi:uncharacterized protein